MKQKYSELIQIFFEQYIFNILIQTYVFNIH